MLQIILDIQFLMQIMKYQKIYKKIKKFLKIKKNITKIYFSFPINKNEITNAILSNKNNLKKIITIVHKEIRKKIKLFLKKNKNKKIVVLDIPLLLENKINKKNDVLVFVESKKIRYRKKIKKKEKILIKNYLINLKKFNFLQIIKKKITFYN